VFPNQIEDAVALHPGVAEVAAIGEPDERSGEVVKTHIPRMLRRNNLQFPVR
jgi:long-chain acyl-CoA synthetase